MTLFVILSIYAEMLETEDHVNCCVWDIHGVTSGLHQLFSAMRKAPTPNPLDAEGCIKTCQLHMSREPEPHKSYIQQGIERVKDWIETRSAAEN